MKKKYLTICSNISCHKPLGINEIYLALDDQYYCSPCCGRVNSNILKIAQSHDTYDSSKDLLDTIKDIGYIWKTVRKEGE